MSRVLLVPAPCVHGARLLPYVPYGLLSLQAAAAGLGPEVDVLALSAVRPEGRFASSDELAESIAALVDGKKYDAVGLSTMCSSFHHSLGVAAALKRRHPGMAVWMGGPHASVDAGLLLDRYPEVDAVFVGEGEAAFGELLARGPHFVATLAGGVAGVRSRDSPFRPRPPIQDLDELPFIDRAGAFLRHLAAAQGETSCHVPLEFERGCPGRCTFCSTRVYWGGRVRHKSNGRMLEEMRRLHALTGGTVFDLVGDNLAFSRRRLLDFCEAVRREGRDYRWSGSLKLDGLVSDDLDALWTGGCRGMFVGIESASQVTLARMHKGIDLARTLRLLYEALERGFSVDTAFVVGFPWETGSDLRATYELHAEVLKRGVAHSLITYLCPLPGTDLERRHRDELELDAGDSTAAVDELPCGPGATALMQRCPELFVQFGRIPNRNVDSVEARAIVRAARMLSAYYERRESERATVNGPRPAALPAHPPRECLRD